jgi:hypothetical protein
MSQESIDDANEVIYDLKEASTKLSNATSYAKRYVKDPELHKRLDETKAKIDDTTKYLSGKINPQGGG